MNIDASAEDLHGTHVNALSAYICSVADKIKENADTPAYFKSMEIPHGEMPALFEADIEELYRACVNMSNIVSKHD